MLRASQSWIRIGFDSKKDHLLLKYLGIWVHCLPEYNKGLIYQAKIVDNTSSIIRYELSFYFMLLSNLLFQINDAD